MGMRLQRIEMTDFGPYYGTQTVDFEGARPITVIHGDNMRGKTSLFNALRWVLYGRAYDRFKRLMARVKLINLDAAAAGRWITAVTLAFDVDGTPYEVRRQVQPRKGVIAPRVDGDFDEIAHLSKNGVWHSADQLTTEINRILPEPVSRFFLFDGELLGEYETLLADVDHQAATIKDAIDRILGVPAIEHALTDIRVNHKDASRRLQDLAKQDSKASLLANMLTQKQSEIEQAERDLAELNEELAKFEERQRTLQEQVQETAGIQKDFETLQSLDKKIGDLNLQKSQLWNDRQSKLANAWRDLLQPMIERRRSELEEERDRAIAQVERIAESRARRALLETFRRSGVCPVCGRTAPPDGIHSDEALVDQGDGATDADLLNRLGSSIQRLSEIRPTGAAVAIAGIEAQLDRLLVELASTDQERDRVASRLKEHDARTVTRVFNVFRQVTEDIGNLREKIDDKKAEISRLEGEASRARAQMQTRPGTALDALNREVEAYDQLIDLLHAAIAELRDELRRAVEHDASAIFKQITTDKSYRGLRINEHYGLTIVDEHGMDVVVRSSGAEQVVALSLIGALNRNAVRTGPVIMDTPFGRLDPQHRENILRFLPEMAEQEVILVHGGEVDPNRDLDAIRDQVNREYVIEYVSSRQSRLVLCSEGE